MRITQYLASKLKNFSNLPKEYIERSKKQASKMFYFESTTSRSSRNN